MKSNVVIVVNPGHAPDTPGKCSPDKSVREHQWNMETASIVVEKLREMGIKYALAAANKESESLSLPVKLTKALCKIHGTDNVLFVAIHCNAAGSGGKWCNARGWSVWTTKGKTKSDELASCLHAAAVEEWGAERVRKDMSDGDPDYESNFYVLRNTPCTAVLIEHFFMDNRADCEYLKTVESKEASARVIVEGIKKYLV